ncbi:MAG: formylglycine-generating enzyme family protein [Myxococcales bacterium]|nr:MAG: formylglycine-generating enzyme family protein [Myxococcales bacterium]
MKRIILALVFLSLSSLAHAQVPAFITYSGRLTDGTWGQSLVVPLDFPIYDAATDGSLLWTQHFDAVAIEDGYFSVTLGDGENALGDPLNVTEVFAAHGETWITVSVDGSDELEPRQPVGSVPYAVRAENSVKVNGMPLVASLKVALGYSDNLGNEDYLSDAAFTAYMRKECPLGYERVDDANITATGYYCKRGTDEMVKAGDFWVDRYENVIVDATKYNSGDCNGSGGTIYGQNSTDPGSVWDSVGFPKNGQATQKLYACSVKNNAPTRNVTWFQAQAACGFSGKVLPTNAQWQLAAQGTPDPDSTQPTPGNEKCNIWGEEGSKPSGSLWGPQVNETIQSGSAAQCQSTVGAYDMIGNVWEWTEEWNGFVANSIGGLQPAEFNGDGWMDVESARGQGIYSGTPSFPAAALRGGDWNDEVGAGVFALSMGSAPSSWGSNLGFRCCRR